MVIRPAIADLDNMVALGIGKHDRLTALFARLHELSGRLAQADLADPNAGAVLRSTMGEIDHVRKLIDEVWSP